MSSRRESTESVRDETAKRYGVVTKLLHYTSKFGTSDEGRRSTLQTPVRHPPPSRNDRRRSTLETSDRFA